MFLCICICLFACACSSSLRVRLYRDSFLSFEESTIKHGDKVIELFEFYEIEDPEHLFGEGKCPLTYLCPIHSLIHLPRYTFIPKD
jgi:hypothetical protein